LNNLRPVPVFPEQEEMDWVGFEPTTYLTEGFVTS
jgi:hypothetical protein